MKGFIKFLLSCLCIILVVSSIVLVVKIYKNIWNTLWVTLYGWFYVAIIVASVIILSLLKVLFENMLLNWFTGKQKAELRIASQEDMVYREKYFQEKDKQKQQHELELETLIEQRRTEIEENRQKLKRKNDELEETILSLKERKKVLQEKIRNNSVLHEKDIEFRKVYRLIECMESNRADTVKEALLYDDQYMANKRELERREKAEQMERQAQEQFRKQQLELLEKSLKEQEIQNNKISKQNEELLKLEREKADDIKRMRQLRDEEYYKKTN